MVAPSNMRQSDHDYAVIVSYNNATGEMKLDRQLNYYHDGTSTSTAPKYNGLDIRAEVVLLSRNIKISGTDLEAWGCQVLTSDFIEGNGEQRLGVTILENVEIYNCSQYDTFKAAVRFEGALEGLDSVVSNCSIHHGLGIGVHVFTSRGVRFEGNSIYDFKKFGLNI